MRTAAFIVILSAACPVLAQPEITWHSIDCGGGTIAGTLPSGSVVSIDGSTGQPEVTRFAAADSGASISITGGFWPIFAVTSRPRCIADFNHDGDLNPDDLGDYINCYFSVPPCSLSDFNGDGDVNPDDLGDFINAYFAGCP